MLVAVHNAKGDKTKIDKALVKESLPYLVVTKDGVADPTIADKPNEFRKASDYVTPVEKQLKAGRE